MIYEIKRGSTVVAAIRAAGTQERSIMSYDRVSMSFSLPTPITFKRGDTVTVYGQTYKLNRPPSKDAFEGDKFGYQYELEFEALYYDLAKWQFKGLSANNQLTISEVYITGTAATIMDLVVRNANRADSGWTMGVVDETDARQFTYVNQSLLAVLHDLAQQFETEFWVDNKTIHLQKREADSGISLSPGKGNGLYVLDRVRSENNSFNRLYVEGGSNNLPEGYGYSRLQLPIANRPFLQDIQPGDEVIEHTVHFDNIFPSRTGTLTGLGSDAITFIDSGIDFDINPLTGKERISFVSGQLASFEFKIISFNAASKTIRIERITDDPAYPGGIPDADKGFVARVGDKYVLLGVKMPGSYVTDNEKKLLEAAQQYLDDNKGDNYVYSGSLSPIWVKENNPSFQLGYRVKIKDDPRGIDKETRIVGYSRDLQEDARYSSFDLADTISPNEIARQYAQQERILYAIQTAGLLDPEYMRKFLFLNRLSESNGYLYLGADKIKAGFADYATDSDMWDGHQFADFINQPLRTGDSPRFAGTGSPAFVSGFSGHGWRVVAENGDVHATFDKLTVRKEMNVYELVINQIRATNGSVWVSDAIKIFGVTVSGTNYNCTIDTDGNKVGVPFLVNDILRCQRWTGRNVKYYVARVTAIGTGTFTLVKLDGGGVPEAGDDVVRMGSTTNTARQGAIYLTASDNGAPYIDVIDGVTSASLVDKTKVRLGKLDGIVSPVWGALSGYGIWTNKGYFENVNVSGVINVQGGNAATQDYAQQLVNNIAIGAVNLIPDRSSLDALTGWSVNVGGVTLVQDGGRNVIQVASSVSGRGIYRNLSTAVTYRPDTQYTLSVDVKSISGASSLYIGWDQGTQKTFNISATSGWQRISVTTSTPKPYIVVYSAGALAQTFIIRDIKLEEGNKATGWTPSPLEIQAELFAAKQLGLDAQTAALLANTRIGNKTIIVGGFIDTGLIKADAVVIGGGGATTAALNAAISNIAVGVMNLALGTGFDKAPTAWAGTSISVVNAIPNYLIVRKSQASYGFSLPLTEDIEANTDYTLSFDWGASDTSALNYLHILSPDGNVKFTDKSGLPVNASSWSRQSLTFRIPAKKTSPQILIATNAGTTIRIRAVKLEKGNKATAWSPSFVDVSVDATTKADAARSAAIADTNSKIGALPAGQTIIATVNGVAFIKTDLINVTEIFAKNVTATGLITANNLTVAGNSKIGQWSVNAAGIYSGQSGAVNDTFSAFSPGSFHLKRNGNVGDGSQVIEVMMGALGLGMDAGARILHTLSRSGNNTALMVGARNGTNNTALNVLYGDIVVQGQKGRTETFSAQVWNGSRWQGSSLVFVNGILVNRLWD